jgi:NADPH2:quinone reductase
MHAHPATMKAAAIDRFGGPEELTLHILPVPEPGPGEVLIQVDTSGVGVWDPYDRTGEMTEILGGEPSFPYVLGTDGAGTVVELGENVSKFSPGDRVYAYGELDPRSRFHAEYAIVKADNAAHVPSGLSLDQAGAMPADAVTAIVGLDDVMKLRGGETLLIFGASGGIGHLAVQLAKRIGARVLAVASGDDGVALVRDLGADAWVDGHAGDVAAAAARFAPNGIDAALITASGEGIDDAIAAIREGGRVAYPNGVEPAPSPREGIEITAYDGQASPERLVRLNQLIESGPFRVHVARTFSLDQAAEAHKALSKHFLGKLAVKT